MEFKILTTDLSLNKTPHYTYCLSRRTMLTGNLVASYKSKFSSTGVEPSLHGIDSFNGHENQPSIHVDIIRLCVLQELFEVQILNDKMRFFIPSNGKIETGWRVPKMSRKSDEARENIILVCTTGQTTQKYGADDSNLEQDGYGPPARFTKDELLPGLRCGCCWVNGELRGEDIILLL